MKNLKELMKSVKELKFTKDEFEELIARSIYQMGGTKAMIITIEELGELVNVIAENTLNKTDYIHTVEEITDVYISLEYCIQTAHIKEFELQNDEIDVPIKKRRVMSYIRVLSETQQSITKFIRRASNSRQRLIKSIIKTYKVLDDLVKFYDIEKIDIDKMKQLKLARLKDRLEKE